MQSRRAACQRARNRLFTAWAETLPMLTPESLVPARATAGDLRLTLHRLRLLDDIVAAIDSAMLPGRMAEAALDALARATGAAGAVPVGPETIAPPHTPPGLVAEAIQHLATCPPDGFAGELAGHPTLLCPVLTRFGTADGIALWRTPGAASWTEADCTLVAALGPVLRIVLDHAAISGALALQIRTDLLTGFGNRAAFADELPRRIERLERDGLPGALLHVNMPGVAALHRAGRQETAELSIRMTAALLRTTVRPADLLARLGTSSFAAWLDGADELSAAERAATLCRAAPLLFARRLPETGAQQNVVIGVAARWPGSGEEADGVMRRAATAATAARKAGGWKVAPPPDC